MTKNKLKPIDVSKYTVTDTGQVLKMNKEVEVIQRPTYEELKAQIGKMKDCLNKWYKQHNDDDYTETFYDNLLRDTEKCLWGDSVND